MSDTELSLSVFQAEDMIKHEVHDPALNMAVVTAAFGNAKSPSAK